MQKQPPSIFNDVIGPVMRGPSSSHTAASVRIGRLVRHFFRTPVISFHVDFDPAGSLATTYSSQGSDIGLVGGLLNMETANPELGSSLEIAAAGGMETGFHVVDYQAAHPNTYRIKAKAESGQEHSFIFISTGGGMFELQEIDGLPVSICGDFYEVILLVKSADRDLLEKHTAKLKRLIPDLDYCDLSHGDTSALINIKTGYPLPGFIKDIFSAFDRVEEVVLLEPVLPVPSRKDCSVPYSSGAGILAAAKEENLSLWELALRYECARGDISAERVMEIGRKIVTVIKNSIREGLAGTNYGDRILGPQAHKMHGYTGPFSGGERDKNIISYITAIMETKSAMGVIVAAPTAGSCGGLPGTLVAVAEELQVDDEIVLQGLLAAGLVGVVIATRSTFAAEECGCQAECGAGSGMAAAGLVQMMGGTAEQALDAASMALQSIIGMVCDPVAERVEVPCLGKNILAGFNAAAAANMALAGYDKVIPLDETIDAMHQAGTMIPPELRCTGKAGLSVTPTARSIDKTLKNQKEGP